MKEIVLESVDFVSKPLDCKEKRKREAEYQKVLSKIFVVVLYGSWEGLIHFI